MHKTYQRKSQSLQYATLDGKAKYALWPLVDQGVFTGLSRDGRPIGKTYDGSESALRQGVMPPPAKY